MLKSTKIMTVLLATLLITSSIYSAELLGAGATFPYPFYAKLFSEYYKKTGVKINYQAIGSGGGIQQLKNKTVNFGASDAFLSNAELKSMPGHVIHIPTCLGAVVLAYNLPGVANLRLNADVIADIFLGKISNWNDSRIQALNPGAALPNQKLVSVHRSDGSGTTSIFTDYLNKVDKEWGQKVGAGKSVNWPIGLGAKGNAGVSGMIKQIPGSIGYVELNFAEKNKMAYATVQNKSGNFIKPSLEATSQAADVAMPADTRVSITNTEADNGYPIGGFTWLLVYQDLNISTPKDENAKALSELLSWVIHDGQAYAKTLDYSPLPASSVKKAEVLISTLKF